MAIPDNITIFVDPHPQYGMGYLVSSLTYDSEDSDEEPSDDGYFSAEYNRKKDALVEARKVARAAIKTGDAKSVTILLDGDEVYCIGKETAKENGKKRYSKNSGYVSIREKW